MQLSWLIDCSSLDHQTYFSDITNVHERISIYQNKVRLFAWLNRSKIMINLHEMRRHDRCGTKSFQRTQAGMDIKFQFPPKAKTRQTLIGSSHHRNACFL